MTPATIPLYLALGGCGPECVDDGQCAGLNEACIEGKCEAVQCTTSAQCDIGQFCDVARDHTCKDGCATDDDCAAGELCDADSHECEEYGCRTTALDCEIGEYCDEDEGECLQDTRAHCQVCEYDIWTGADDCSGSADCFLFDEQQYLTYCLVTCNVGAASDQCPRGFECVTLYDSLDQPIGDYCYADCLYVEDYLD